MWLAILAQEAPAGAEGWWITWGQHAVWIAALLGAIGVILAIPPVKWFRQFVWRKLISEPVSSWGKKVISDVVEEKVTQTNGGSSLADRLNQMNADIQNVHGCLDRRFGETHEQMSKLAETVDAFIATQIGSTERVMQIYRAIDIPIFEMNSSGRCSYVNPAWTKMTGLSLDETIGEGWAAALHPDDRDRVFKTWLDDAALKGDFASIFRIRNVHTGHVTQVFASAAPLHDGKGQVVGWVGTAEPFSPHDPLTL